MISAWHKASDCVIAKTIAAMATPAYADVVVGPRFSYYFDKCCESGNFRTCVIAGGKADQGGSVDQFDIEREEEQFPGQAAFQSLDQIFRQTAIRVNEDASESQIPCRTDDLPFNVFVAGMRSLPIP